MFFNGRGWEHIDAPVNLFLRIQHLRHVRQIQLRIEAGTAVIDRRDLHALLLLVYQQTPVAVVPVEVAQKRIREKHVPEEGAELIRGIQCLLIDSLQNGVQLLAVAILLTVDAGVLQLGELNQPFSALCEITAGNHQLALASAVRVIAQQGILYPEAQHLKNVTGHIFADTAVGVAHLFVPAGARRELQHVAGALIGDIDLVPIRAAIGAKTVDRAVGKIDHRSFLPTTGILLSGSPPAPS